VIAGPSPQTPPCTFIVAIHGIGDQIEYATVQSVVVEAGKYCGTLTSVPLGSFYPVAASAIGGNARIAPEPQILPEVGGLGFGEVYWAGIARGVSRNGYILEETKKWGRSIVARLAARAASLNRPMSAAERFRIITVLDELIETIAVLDRLTLVADKAGLFKFQLKTLLDNFVGDVQIVADFGAYRERILAEFTRVMEQALAVAGAAGVNPATDADHLPNIHLVAHSEGSVVMFTALLAAMSARQKYPWIRAIKGVMTIGSPIEIHHLLWPNLWQSLRPDSAGAAVPVPWCNYLDHGDPIAYELRATREWMKKTGFDQVLSLREFAFSRSFVPGKAHTDYWTDDAVFGHFFDTVVKLPRDERTVPKPADPVPNRRLAQLSSYLLPQVLIAGLHFLATFVLYRAIYAALAPDADLSVGDVAQDVFGIGLMLLGMTAVARIPRLTNSVFWRAASVATLFGSMGVFVLTTSATTRDTCGALFGSYATEGVWLTVLLIALVSGWAGSKWPRTGVRALPILGLLGTFGLIGAQLYQAYTQDQHDVSVWPVLLASAAFFYLWWLGALLFDLVFVWNVHVRHSKVADEIETIVTQGYVMPARTKQHWGSDGA